MSAYLKGMLRTVSRRLLFRPTQQPSTASRVQQELARVTGDAKGSQRKLYYGLLVLAQKHGHKAIWGNYDLSPANEERVRTELEQLVHSHVDEIMRWAAEGWVPSYYDWLVRFFDPRSKVNPVVESAAGYRAIGITIWPPSAHMWDTIVARNHALPPATAWSEPLIVHYMPNLVELAMQALRSRDIVLAKKVALIYLGCGVGNATCNQLLRFINDWNERRGLEKLRRV